MYFIDIQRPNKQTRIHQINQVLYFIIIIINEQTNFLL